MPVTQMEMETEQIPQEGRYLPPGLRTNAYLEDERVVPRGIVVEQCYVIGGLEERSAKEVRRRGW